MIHSMEILQLSKMALEEKIYQEVNENPVLELQEYEPDEGSFRDETPEQQDSDFATAGERELVVDEQQDNVDDFERLNELDREFPDFFDETPRRSANFLDDDADRKHDAMANIECRPQSLQDFLLAQLGEMNVDPEILEIAERIISCLDPADGGYFRTSLDDLLPADAGPDQRQKARQALELVQTLEPAGVAARSLRECLQKQLQPTMPYYEIQQALIQDHLEDLRDNRLPAIKRCTGYSIEDIMAAWNELRKLNPKPASAFADSTVPAVTPDVVVEKGEDDRYHVIVDDSRTPALRISEYYRRRLAAGTATAEEREFIKHKINAAQWLIEAIEQRRSTLIRVSQAVVDHQQRFLDDGPEYIEPLKMQQIAEQVGVHVTTVSRAVDDKWIQTPRGILPLRKFFVGGTQSEDGEDVAWAIIRLRLQELIDAEDKAKPLSDDELVDELAKHGLRVARRTITKYRQTMGIPSSRQRRDWTQAKP